MNPHETEFAMYTMPLSGSTNPASEEVLVADSRDRETPSESVERKLVSVLQSGQLCMSRLQFRRPRCPAA